MFDIFSGSEPPKWPFCSSQNVCPSRRRWSLRFYDRNWYSFWMQAPKYSWTSWSVLQWRQTLGKMNFCINTKSIYSFYGTKIRFLNCHNLKTKSDRCIAAIVIQVIPNFLVFTQMWLSIDCTYLWLHNYVEERYQPDCRKIWINIMVFLRLMKDEYCPLLGYPCYMLVDMGPGN